MDIWGQLSRVTIDCRLDNSVLSTLNFVTGLWLYEKWKIFFFFFLPKKKFIFLSHFNNSLVGCETTKMKFFSFKTISIVFLHSSYCYKI